MSLEQDIAMAAANASAGQTHGRLDVTSEIAYDLLQEHVDTILAALERPLSHEEIMQRLGSEQSLRRALRCGLLQEVQQAGHGLHYQGVSGVYQQMRQENMLSFLERYILPCLSASAEGGVGSGYGTLENRSWVLSKEQMRQMRKGPVQKLLEHLSVINNEPVQGTPTRLSIIVVGTSEIQADHGSQSPAQNAITHLRKASEQRLDPSQRDLALLTQLDTLACPQRYQRSMQALDTWLSQQPASISDAPNYHLSVASYWHGHSDHAHAHDQESLPC